MGLKIFINCISSHTGRVPMAVSSGLKRSQRVSKGLQEPRNRRRRAHPCVSHGLTVPRNLRRRAHPRASQGFKVPRSPRRHAPRTTHRARATFGICNTRSPPSSSHKFPITNKDSPTTGVSNFILLSRRPRSRGPTSRAPGTPASAAPLSETTRATLTTAYPARRPRHRTHPRRSSGGVREFTSFKLSYDRLSRHERHCANLALFHLC